MTPSSCDTARTESQTMPWSALGRRPAAASMRLLSFLSRRSRGWAASGAGAKLSALRPPCQRPASTQLTGTVSAAPAATRTVWSNVRFCWAPRTSSPSNSRIGWSVGLWTVRFWTSPPAPTSLTAAPNVRAWANDR